MTETRKQIVSPTPTWIKIARSITWAVYVIWMGLYLAATEFRIDGDLFLTAFGVGFILLIIYAVNVSAIRSIIDRATRKSTDR
jgi:hypothetical protein